MSAEGHLLRRIEQLEREVGELHRELSRLPLLIPVGGGGGGIIKIVDAETEIETNWEGWKTPTLVFALNTQRLWLRVDDGYVCLSQVAGTVLYEGDE